MVRSGTFIGGLNADDFESELARYPVNSIRLRKEY
jgi:hypothetical protein